MVCLVIKTKFIHHVDAIMFLQVLFDRFCFWGLDSFLIANLDLDGAGQLSYSENLSYGEDDPVSAHSQSPREVGNTRQHGAAPQETSVPRSLRLLQLETAFNNRGFEESCAADSSSMWSPEASYLFSILFLLECCVLSGEFLLSSCSPCLKKKISPKRKHCLEKQRPKEPLFEIKFFFRWPSHSPYVYQSKGVHNKRIINKFLSK